MDFTMRQTPRVISFALTAIAMSGAAALFAGCAAPQVGPPLTESTKTDTIVGRARYQRELSQRRVCTNDDAFHMLIDYVNDVDTCSDYEARVRWLNERQMLPEHFDRPAGEAIMRGTLAVALAKLLNYRGGIMHLAAPRSPRYATRELVYRGIYPAGSSPQQTYSGVEIIGVLAAVEDAQRGDPTALAASQLQPAVEKETP
jgi:hypothetical protein